MGYLEESRWPISLISTRLADSFAPWEGEGAKERFHLEFPKGKAGKSDEKIKFEKNPGRSLSGSRHHAFSERCSRCRESFG